MSTKYDAQDLWLKRMVRTRYDLEEPQPQFRDREKFQNVRVSGSQ